MAYKTNSKIKIIMEEKNIKPKDLADSLGMHRVSIYHLINNDVFARPRKIAKALGVELKDIVE